MLDLAGSLGRRFGGIGAGVSEPSVVVRAAVAPTLTVDTAPTIGLDTRAVDEARRSAQHAAERLLACYAGREGGADRGARITLHRLIPPHQGLGSGTQLALATASAIARLYDLPHDPAILVSVVGRATRSAVGTYVFGSGGLVLEGGRPPRRAHEDRPAPLVARLPIPDEWRCVLTLPNGHAGLSGDREVEAFASLPTPPVADAERVAHLVMMALLPALADADYQGFGAALTEIQQINGRWFASQQGGSFAAGPSAELVERLSSWGITGVGQSSWGPAVYAVLPDPDAAAALARRIRQTSIDATVLECSFSSTGARTWDEVG
jgi:beta-ribofuranosylaminobenzene 5'-phosphate synthase